MTIGFTGSLFSTSWSTTLPLAVLDTGSSSESLTIPKDVIPSATEFRKRLVKKLSMAATEDSITEIEGKAYEEISSSRQVEAEISGSRQVEAEISSSRKVEAENINENITDGENKLKSKKKGGWKLAILLLVNQGLATLAFFGLGVNLVLFLTRVLGHDNANAARSVSTWTGTVYLCSLIGAFLSDSYWGRYLTCAIFQLIIVLGLGILSLASWLFLLKPADCGDGIRRCTTPSQPGVAMFYLSIYLVALGYGGHQPTLATLGSDQFDDSHPKGAISKAAFFSYFYFALNVGSLFSNTILVYYEDSGKWTLGFLVSLGSAIIALLVYLLGTPRYRYMKASGNPLPRVAQVFVAAYRKWGVPPAAVNDLYEVQGTESAIKGSRKILHSDDFK
ncbi:hypothetical protein V6N12_015892 [Hibiscus sabdariffa]